MANHKNKMDETAGRFAYEGLERIMHEKARLSILSSLVTHPKALLFNDLKDFCALTDGWRRNRWIPATWSSVWASM